MVGAGRNEPRRIGQDSNDPLYEPHPPSLSEGARSHAPNYGLIKGNVRAIGSTSTTLGCRSAWTWDPAPCPTSRLKPAFRPVDAPLRPNWPTRRSGAAGERRGAPPPEGPAGAGRRGGEAFVLRRDNAPEFRPSVGPGPTDEARRPCGPRVASAGLGPPAPPPARAAPNERERAATREI